LNVIAELQQLPSKIPLNFPLSAETFAFLI